MEKEEKSIVLHKFTKANLKLNIPLEPSQFVYIFDVFLNASLL
jgi:hypothetical protein